MDDRIRQLFAQVKKCSREKNWEGAFDGIRYAEQICRHQAGQSICRERWLTYLLLLEFAIEEMGIPEAEFEPLLREAYSHLRTGFVETVQYFASKVRATLESRFGI